MITIAKGGDIIEYLRSLHDNDFYLHEDAFHENINILSPFSNKKPCKFHVYRDVRIDDRCIICDRPSAYNFYDLLEKEDHWVCGYCAVNIATSFDFIYSEKIPCNKILGISQHLIRELEMITI